jgi:hypothetical protein
MTLRKLGIGGEDKPSKIKNQRITFANFEIGGLVCKMRRQYDKTMEINAESFRNLSTIFGERLESQYGWDSIEGFFNNSKGGKLYVKSNTGNDGSLIDAVASNVTISDQSNPTVKIESAYQDNLSYGVDGDKTLHTLTNGSRYETEAAATAIAAATSIKVDAIGDTKKGDIMKINLTGGAPVTVEHKITDIDESTNEVHFTGPLHASSTLEIGDEVKIMGIQLKIYRKSDSGVITEVEKDKGLIYGNMESEVTDYYLPNIFKDSSYVKLTDQSSASTAGDRFPSDVTTPTPLANGSDGTSPTTVAHWKFNHSAFDNDPIRMWSNSDTTLKAVFDEMEIYSQARDREDFPVTLPNTAANLSKLSLTTLGNSYQKSEKVYKTIVGTWLTRTDPFSSSAIAPDREVPCVGHVMGAWVRTIRERGIHEIPAIDGINITGVTGVVAPKVFTNGERTEIANAGVNIIQNIEGVGIRIRNFFTPSTLSQEGVTTWGWANGVIEGNFIRESVKESLAPSENQPNVFRNVVAGRTKIVTFMMTLARSGSNGNVPEGVTFGQLFDEETGDAEPLEETFEVIADPSNNANVDLRAGNRDYDIYFKYPTPTGSIRVGIGVII